MNDVSSSLCHAGVHFADFMVRDVLLAYELQEPNSDDAPSSSSADPMIKLPPIVSQWFSDDWSIQMYSEVRSAVDTLYPYASSALTQRYRLVHWHGPRAIGDCKVYLGDEDDTRKFMHTFMVGRRRESRLAEHDADRLQRSQATIMNIVTNSRVESDVNED